SKVQPEKPQLFTFLFSLFSFPSSGRHLEAWLVVIGAPPCTAVVLGRLALGRIVPLALVERPAGAAAVRDAQLVEREAVLAEGLAQRHLVPLDPLAHRG